MLNDYSVKGRRVLIPSVNFQIIKRFFIREDLKDEFVFRSEPCQCIAEIRSAFKTHS